MSLEDVQNTKDAMVQTICEAGSRTSLILLEVKEDTVSINASNTSEQDTVYAIAALLDNVSPTMATALILNYQDLLEERKL